MSIGLAAIAGVAFVYYVVPRIVGLGPTLRRLRTGNVWWLVLGLPLEAISYFGSIALFRGVFATPENQLGWRASYWINLAGTAATKLFAAAGAGGIALTVWALNGYGLSGAEVGTGMVCFEILTYAVYMSAMAIAGFGLWLGLFDGRAPIGVTLIPAVFATAVILIVIAMLFVDQPVEGFLRRRAERSQGRASRWWRRAAAVPRSLHAGLSAAIAMVKRRDRSLLGVLAYWGFDIGVLWACFRAFGHSPPGAVLVMGYYVGTLGNALPLPGGVGGVEGGMIGAFLAFGVPGQLAVSAVLGYRTISYWLPTVPGAIAYARLRHHFGSSFDPGDVERQSR
ncbi:MAG TPA: lysylphosphatidylglycerol synthase transmembrane domain-containing protein [Solirubrobacteraceae bacterium]|nr:lysylphosphatidylglycerol synthase transmembrane domain-containing protein [Solirubrobacteraceae bacterium]